MLSTKFGKIAVGWYEQSPVLLNDDLNKFYYRSAVLILGIGSFYLSKKSIDNRRYEDMKIRQRMKESNTGDYSPSYRFSRPTSQQS